MGNSSRDGEGAFPDGYAVPITGLLSVLFALLAGLSLLPALSGSPGELAVPGIFGAISIIAFRLRQGYLAREEQLSQT